MNNIKLFFTVVVLTITSLNAFSQSELYLSFFDDLQYPKNDSCGTLTIDQSPDIENFVLRHLSKQQGKKVQGYRVRVFSGRGSQAKIEWDRLSVELQQKYNVGIYKEYDVPHYKIYMGDFRTRNEAQKFSKEIEYKYAPLIIGPRDIIVKYNND